MANDNWTSLRSRKAAATRKARYGPDVFKKLGKIGGSRPKPKKIDDLPVVEQYEALESEKNIL